MWLSHLNCYKKKFRLVHQILNNHGDYRITAAAVKALQEASEMILVQLFEDSALFSFHRQRVTLSIADFKLAAYFYDQ